MVSDKPRGPGDHFLFVCVFMCIQGWVCVPMCAVCAHVCPCVEVRGQSWVSFLRVPLLFKHVFICVCLHWHMGEWRSVDICGSQFPLSTMWGPRD